MTVTGHIICYSITGNSVLLSLVCLLRQVTLSVAATTLYSFARTTTATLISGEGGRRGLLWAGFSVQFGTCIGTILGFILVNVVKLFEEKLTCP